MAPLDGSGSVQQGSKVPIPGSPEAGSPTSGGQASGPPDSVRPEWWERAVAAVIDGAMFAVPGFILQVVLIRVAFGDQNLMLAMSWLAIALSVVAFVLYKSWMESRPRQATVGKMLLGLKVVTADGTRPTFRQAVLRTWPWWFVLLTGVEILLSLAALVILIAAYLVSLLSRDGRGLHDRTVGCVVLADMSEETDTPA
ncbi:MAG: RDD family protein [Pseudomonadota bacterium]